MTDRAPTADELLKAAVITDAEIDEACGAFVADLRAAPFRFGSGHMLDVVDAVQAHSPAKAAVEGINPSVSYRCSMVRTAILKAQPTAP